MASLLVRNVPQSTIDSLKARAHRRHRSLQAEVLDVLQTAVLPSGERMVAWLETSREPGVKSGPGLRALKEDRSR